ncbi:MAG: HAMP domain-containing histidine kinase [Deltaproteobacteria bacterium]|nr:HAMP domain-containing histidine kinase [Deltaproteobacteria bacterium]
MTRRTKVTMVGFLISFLVVLSGVGWISATALRLDRAERAAREQAALEESVRLALWRLDSSLTPLIARESARDPVVFGPFYPPDGPFEPGSDDQKPEDVLVMSPLLQETPTHVRLHFQFDPAGRLTSPQAPTGELRGLAERRGVGAAKIDGATQALTELSKTITRDQLKAALAPSLTRPEQKRTPQPSSLSQVDRNFNEWQMRTVSMDNAANPNPGATAALAQSALVPLWVGEELVLVRQVTVAGRELLQGAWLDWPEIQRWLPTTIEDLLPEARFEPHAGGQPKDRQRSLAALPVRLVPGASAVPYEGSRSSVGMVLLIAWSGLLLAAIAIAVLVAGTVSLSERRARFVSAVTHELRTPLTNLRAYSEMLVEGKITKPEKKQRYLRTLHREALRLCHLVENVLSYSRIERGRRPAKNEALCVAQVLEHAAERLEERVAQADMTLQIDLPDGDESLRLLGDEAALEQILFNLVDNACKYARKAEDRRIAVTAERNAGRVELKVTDQGPGIPKTLRGSLFEPFSKSAEEAARSAPGVGLGLALSRRLAKAMGGDLRLGATGSKGTTFVLTLRAASRRG